jgi:hypothetical protein
MAPVGHAERAAVVGAVLRIGRASSARRRRCPAGRGPEQPDQSTQIKLQSSLITRAASPIRACPPARPRLLMRSARGTASSSRRHASDAAAETSSIRPSRSSLPTTLQAAPPLRILVASPDPRKDGPQSVLGPDGGAVDPGNRFGGATYDPGRTSATSNHDVPANVRGIGHHLSCRRARARIDDSHSAEAALELGKAALQTIGIQSAHSAEHRDS